MKTAVCISGICRGNAKTHIERFKRVFNSDIFFGTWKGKEGALENIGIKEYFLFEEPEQHYHPFVDVPIELLPDIEKTMNNRNKAMRDRGYRERTFHQAKQIIGHAYMMQKLPDEYDMIIRTRYDTYVSDKVDFNHWLNVSYNEHKAIGFGTRIRRHNTIDELKVIPHLKPETGTSHSPDWYMYLPDQVIFHRRDMFDVEMVLKLFKDKMLISSERGWHQVLSKPFGNNHESIYGGAQHERLLRGTKHS